MQIKDFFTKGSCLMLIPLVGFMYGPLNQDNGQVHTLVTVLDQRIPFNQYFIVPYLTWYVFIFAVPVWFLQKDCRLYFSSITAITFGLLASFGIYSVFQTTVPRPDLAGNDLFSQLTKALYQMDNPYNAFPSIHVMTSYILFLGCYRTKEYAPKISLLVQGMAIVIILSTLFIKQHTLLDVAGGVFLGGILFKLIGMLTDFIYRERILSQAIKYRPGPSYKEMTYPAITVPNGGQKQFSLVKPVIKQHQHNTANG